MAVPADEDVDVKVPPTGGDDVEVVFEDAPSTKIAKDLAAEQEAEKKAAREEKERIEAEKRQAAAPPPRETPVVADDGSESLKRQIADLTRQREEGARREREALRGREEAERRFKAESERRENIEKESAYTRLNLIVNAIDAVNQRAEAAERDFRQAMEIQDYAAGAKAQRAMSNAEARLTALEAEKMALEGADPNRRQAEGRVTPREEPRQQEPIRVRDQVDELASRLSPASAAWVRSHPECVTDQVLNSEMIAAHNRAIRNGIPVDSDSYFEFIESRLGIGSSADTRSPAPQTNGARQQNGTHVELPSSREIDRESDPPPPQRRPSVAAPVTRDVPTNSGTTGTPRTLTLSPAEREFCDLNDPDNPDRYKEYAKAKIALAKEGKLSNNRLN